ncbi:MAG: glycosyltransferase N-terminal domain-containing protein [Bacteroidales bacterium]
MHIYELAIKISSIFNDKAKHWVHGRKDIFNKLRSAIGNTKNVTWFHAASLGEFEQGRPVIEAFKKKYPEKKILLTFFSPSGYEPRKDYPGVDFVFYLPVDTLKNAKKFLSIVNPETAIFIKYEFWFNYLKFLRHDSVPTFLISGIFRENQHFFKWYGKWFRKQLSSFTHFFVQNEKSEKLLHSIGFPNVSISGDTRFDRVADIAKQNKEYPLIAQFAKENHIILAGSSWSQDETFLPGLFNLGIPNLKIIIAPHEIKKERISEILTLFKDRNPITYSYASAENINDSDVLVIDGMGFLSSLYQYCKIAIIGGGFGKGIHNILEAVTFGKPVIFGPTYDKFNEAVELIHRGGAFSFSEQKELNTKIKKLMLDESFYSIASRTCESYIKENTGATKQIMACLSKYQPN